MVCREEFVVVVFCPLRNSGLPWGWSRSDRREETNAMRVAFDIYLKGLPFMETGMVITLCLQPFTSLDVHNILEGIFIILPI